MPDIVLTTLNARYAHAAFGLRYLLANLGPLRDRASLVEFDISQRPIDMLEVILAQSPRIVGVGVYIWNAEQSHRLVADLKRVRPDVIVVVGGPEVSYETEEQEICRIADGMRARADLIHAGLVGAMQQHDALGRRFLPNVLSQRSVHDAERFVIAGKRKPEIADVGHRQYRCQVPRI